MKFRRKHRRWLLIAASAGIIFVILCNRWVLNATNGQVFGNLSLLPENEVGLVLGTSHLTGEGKPNPHFYGRIEAAAELYRTSKVHRLIVSGANPDPSYNEPRRMQQELVKAGVPPEAIKMDFAGDRTLDSVARAQSVFGLKKMTIITQEYHAWRAVFLARKLGIKAVAYAAGSGEGPALLPWTREVFARVKAALDVVWLSVLPHDAPAPRAPAAVEGSGDDDAAPGADAAPSGNSG